MSVQIGHSHAAWGDVSAAYVVKLTEVATSDDTVEGRIAVGSLAAFCPFVPKRFYVIHGMAKGERRGQHAHKCLWQAMIAMSGGVEIVLDSGVAKRAVTLDHPAQCLIVPPGLWRDITSLHDGAVLFVLASEEYDESDYIRDYESFLAFRATVTEKLCGLLDAR